MPYPTRYHKISHDPAAIESLFVTLFLETHKRPPREIILDLDAIDDPVHGEQEGRFFRGYYDHYCYLPVYIFCGRHLLAAQSEQRSWPLPGSCIFRPVRRNSIRRKISGMKSAKKS